MVHSSALLPLQEALAMTAHHLLNDPSPDACAAEGLLLRKTASRCERLRHSRPQKADHSVRHLWLRRFDVAWRHGLSSFVCDYLADVCGDPQTSADPVRAYLLDGRCVSDWTQKTLQRLRSGVRQARCQAPPANPILRL